MTAVVTSFLMCLAAYAVQRVLAKPADDTIMVLHPGRFRIVQEAPAFCLSAGMLSILALSFTLSTHGQFAASHAFLVGWLTVQLAAQTARVGGAMVFLPLMAIIADTTAIHLSMTTTWSWVLILPVSLLTAFLAGLGTVLLGALDHIHHHSEQEDRP